jgi:hypothetical protein
METVNRAHVAELCPELRTLLESELAAGNQVAETSKGWPRPDSVFVMLALPFRKRPGTLPAGVVYRDVNDPHWWKAQYHHEPTQHLLACPF